jgi:hypothetical protein
MSSDLIGLEKDTLILPRGREQGFGPLVLNMKKVNEVFTKIPELQRATPITLGDLLVAFLLGMAELSRYIASVEMEVKDAKRELEKYRAIALLEKVEQVLADKKIKSTADMREAALALDPAIQTASEKFDMLTAMSNFLYHKYSELLNSYHAAKKIAELWSKTPDGTNYGGSEDIKV